MRAALPSNENARLGALFSRDLLDSPEEPEFNAIVSLAKLILKTPVVLISLVDADRQWFKARAGLDICETTRDVAICAHVVVAGDTVEVPDTLADPRTADNPLCQPPSGFRFYVGAPLRDDGGAILGTLCALDYVPRQLSGDQRTALEALADQTMNVIRLRSELATSDALRKEIDHRVKNSLASVGSLVAIEQRRATSDEAKDVLGRVRQQIGTVALLHQQLSETTDDERIALAGYLDRVVRLMSESNATSMAIDARFEAVPVAPRQAASFASIVNELVANALKHGTGDTIVVRGQRDGAGYRLTCRNRIAAAPVVGDDQRRKLGMDILRALARQLGGELSSGAAGEFWETSVSAALIAAVGGDG